MSQSVHLTSNVFSAVRAEFQVLFVFDSLARTELSFGFRNGAFNLCRSLTDWALVVCLKNVPASSTRCTWWFSLPFCFCVKNVRHEFPMN
jgi:hypothetical protein